ncbi:pyridoxal-dependent decarboxylase, partial [Pseudomonas stutzeri]|nr:pyridoxal-dependent decarboxylase [Stutzerimonas stutzeri]
MTPSSTVVPFAPGPASNGLFTRSNHDDYRRLLQQGLNLVQQCLQRQQQPFSGILPQELAADFERVDLERPLGDAGAALRELDQLYLRDAVYFHHPRYVAHLNCPVVLPAL